MLKCVCTHYMHEGACEGQKRAPSSGTGITGSCELPDVDAGHQPPFLCQNSKFS